MSEDNGKPKKPTQITIPVRPGGTTPGGVNPPPSPSGGGPSPSSTGGGANVSLFDLAHPNEKDKAKWSGREALRQVLSDMGIADELPTSLTDIEDTAQKIVRWGEDLKVADDNLRLLAQKGGFLGLAGADPRKVAAQVAILGQAQDDLSAIKQQFGSFMTEYLHPATGRPAITDDPGRVREREFIYQRTGRQMPITGEDWEAIAKGMLSFKTAKQNELAKTRPDQNVLGALDEAEKLYGQKFDEYSNLIFGGGGKDMIKTPDGRYIDRAKLPGAKSGGWPTDIKPGWYTEMGATDEPNPEEAKLYGSQAAGGMGLSPGEVAAKQKASRAKATAQAAFDQEGGPATQWIRDRGSLRPVGSVVTGSLRAQ